MGPIGTSIYIYFDMLPHFFYSKQLNVTEIVKMVEGKTSDMHIHTEMGCGRADFEWVS